MTAHENLRRAMEEYMTRRHGGRWSVGLAGDDDELLARYAQTVAQLRAAGWTNTKILAALRRKAAREA